ncbi:hypothetical protein Tco_1013559 [Tanacetum coccineum]
MSPSIIGSSSKSPKSIKLRATTTTTSLDAEQDRGNINKTQSKTTLNESSSLGTSSGSGPKRQETIGDTIAQTGFENVFKTSNDSLLAGEITSLKRRVKRLKKKGGSRTHGLKRLYKVGLSRRVKSYNEEGLGEKDASKQEKIADIDANEDIYLVNVHRDEDMFGVNDLEGDEVIVETEVDHEVVVETKVASKDVNLSVDEVTLAQALAALKSAKPKADKVLLQEPDQGTITTTTAATIVTAASKRPKAKGLDKGKGIMVEEPVKMKKKDQISLNEELNGDRCEVSSDSDSHRLLTKELAAASMDSQGVTLSICSGTSKLKRKLHQFAHDYPVVTVRVTSVQSFCVLLMHLMNFDLHDSPRVVVAKER